VAAMSPQLRIVISAIAGAAIAIVLVAIVAPAVWRWLQAMFKRRQTRTIDPAEQERLLDAYSRARLKAHKLPCMHSSVRDDGLDDHCLLCGADGYWLDGKRVDTRAPMRLQPQPCKHSSTRNDGYLDDHCLLCGADGYWLEGRRLDRTHPSGKLLIAVLPTHG
jgi:hypothetical protein